MWSLTETEYKFLFWVCTVNLNTWCITVFWFLMSGQTSLEIGLSSEKLDLESPSAHSLCGCLRNTDKAAVTSLVRVTVLSQPSGCGPKAQGLISGTTLPSGFHWTWEQEHEEANKPMLELHWDWVLVRVSLYPTVSVEVGMDGFVLNSSGFVTVDS